MIEALKKGAKTPQELGFAEALNNGFSIKVLDKKTSQELALFHQNKSFKTIKATTNPRIPTINLKDDRQTVLEAIKKG